MEQFGDLTPNRRRALLAIAQLQSNGEPVTGASVQKVSGMSNAEIHLAFLEGSGYIIGMVGHPKTYHLAPKGEEAVSFVEQLGPEVAPGLNPRRLAALQAVDRAVRETGRATARSLICEVNVGMLKALVDGGYLIRERPNACAAYSYTLTEKAKQVLGSSETP